MAASFSLLDMDAMACGLVEARQWQDWARQPKWPDGAPLPATPAIPPMMARRMSPAIRMAVQLALTLIARWQPTHLICVSRHGELQRTFTLLEKLIVAAPLSPTDFSLSVHNTVAGLATIAAQLALPSTSVAAGIDSFHAGLLEAVATLHSVPGPVLLLGFEGELPSFYAPWIQEQEPAHAVAMVLGAGEQWRFDGEVQGQGGPGLSQALAFWRGHLLGQHSVLLPSVNRDLVWSCLPA